MEPARSMAEFLEASRGVWLTRRAVHHLDHQDDEFGDSNLIVEPFDNKDHAVENVCHSLGINPKLAAGGARFWWESNLQSHSKTDDKAAIIIDIPHQEDSKKGFLVRDKGYVEKQPVLSEYKFSEDGIMTITTRYDTNHGIERCWFVTDQIRMRVSSVQLMDGVSMTTYCTEMRCPSADDLKALQRKAEKIAYQASSNLNTSGEHNV